jgi:CreA protein
MAPAAARTAIRHNEREERSWAFSGSSFPVDIEVPSPSTPSIPESQPLNFSVAEEDTRSQRLLIPAIFAPSVAKKLHIPLNGPGSPSCATFRQSLRALHGQKRRQTEIIMTFHASSQCDTGSWRWIPVVFALLLWLGSPASAADEPDLIFRRSTVFKWLSPNDKLATYGVDDPEVEGVACHFTVPEKGGFTGWVGLAEEVSDISLACRQIGPIRFRDKMGQGDDMFRRRRSLFFKKMQIVRGCDAKRNVLVYMVYSDKLIEGSPKNSTSSVPIMPWGGTDAAVQKCGEFIQ